MSYPRNAASPERVSIGAVVQISDGAVQTSGVAVKVIPFGGSEASGTGTVAYSADGVVLYTPVQGETDYTSFVLVASKAGCIPASTTVVTTASATAGVAVLDSASRLAIWNELTTQSFTADSFGELLIISDGTNGREVKVTGANHIAADVHDVQPDGLTNSTEITNIENASGYLLAVLAGACADPQTASETYAITMFGSTFTVDMAGQTSTGTRTAPTLTKT